MKNVICFGLGVSIGAILGVKLTCDFSDWAINHGYFDDWMLQNMEKRGRIKIKHKDENEEKNTGD